MLRRDAVFELGDAEGVVSIDEDCVCQAKKHSKRARKIQQRGVSIETRSPLFVCVN